MEHQHTNDNCVFNGGSAYQNYMQQECIYNDPFGQPSVMYPSYNPLSINQATIQVNQQYNRLGEFHNHFKQKQHIPLATTGSYNDTIVQQMPSAIDKHTQQQHHHQSLYHHQALPLHHNQNVALLHWSVNVQVFQNR